jgi:two-component system sensor histidine kinase DegS
VNIVLRDDGKGFDPSVATEGFGLIGMLERVELLDGTLSVASNPGRGSTITATLPARRASPKEQARGITSVG